MKKKSLLIIGLLATAFIANNYILSMESTKKYPVKKYSVIPGASYYIYDREDADSCPGGVPCSSEFVDFYTFDGNQITKMELKSCCTYVDELLDINAPKPQPVSCLIKYRSEIEGVFESTRKLPRWLIHFLDKNGNKIRSYRYHREEHEIIMAYHGDRIETLHFDESNPQLIDKKFSLDLSRISNIRAEDPFGCCIS